MPAYIKALSQILKRVALTARETKTVVNQLSRGVKNPVITRAGVKLSVGEVETVEKLMKNFKPPTSSNIRRGVKKVLKDKVITTAGFEIPIAQYREFQRMAKNINAYITRQAYRDTALRVKRFSKIGVEPTRPAEPIFSKRSASIGRFKTREEFTRAYEYYKEQLSPSGRRKAGPRANYLFFIEKSNWSRAFFNRFSVTALYDRVDRAIAMIDPEIFHDMINSGELPNVGEVYVDDWDSIYDWIEGALPLLESANTK